MRRDSAANEPISVLYVAPWVDIGGADTATIDWFKFLDRSRFRASLITTQPSPNRRLSQVVPYAHELWELPQLMSGPEFPGFILSFIHTRRVGLVHIMNSRLGFDLLPDIASLPERPRVVVQLHGEEPNRAGYVRYVTTRYGNLVDAFSLTTAASDRSLDEYDVAAGKRRLIPIGVDAESEFHPDRVAPVGGLDKGTFHVLFPARLTAQKEPLLMVEVAARLKAAGLRFQIHVLGDGDLEGEVRRLVSERGLQQEVVMHGARVDIAPWYAACDVVLMTSKYETSPPRVAHEAMAMVVPVVAPQLPVLEELITARTGVLIDAPNDAEAYARAICELAVDVDRRRAIGESAREQVRSQFAVEQMAAGHASLYEELLSIPKPLSRSAPTPVSPAPSRASPKFSRSRSAEHPLVSVIITSFNQGRYLRGCLASIAHQSYRPIETILVDDCSTEAETVQAISAIERAGSAIVLRLKVNRGPSAARNAGIERARGRYILPLDCDDLLDVKSVGQLVEQLERAPEEIGFIYPSLQFFGNRVDRWEMPSYNLHGLLSANHCPVSSLIDREVFDRGLRYPEDITLGDEDWDFVLTLADHGIYGQAGAGQALLCRKHGFTRSDLVHVGVPFAPTLVQRHRALFAQRGQLKGQWNPSLTILALDPLADRPEVAQLIQAALEQTCPDFELIVAGSSRSGDQLERRLRWLPVEPDCSRAGVLTSSLELARGRYVLAVYAHLGPVLNDRAFVEKVLRVLGSDGRISALALSQSNLEQVSLSRSDGRTASGAPLLGLCWTAAGPAAPPASLQLDAARPLEDLARWLALHGKIQWRHLVASHENPRPEHGAGPGSALGAPCHRRPVDAKFREAPPELPACPPGVPHRLGAMEAWAPVQVRFLYRHRHHSGRYLYTNDGRPPSGCIVDRLLGCLRALPFPGTVAVRGALGTELRFGGYDGRDEPDLLGFADETPLPLLDELRVARHPTTGQEILVGGGDDPLAAGAHDLEVVGYIEPHPLRPRALPDAGIGVDLAGLLRTADLRSRQHRYGVGHYPHGTPAGELGALLTQPIDDCDPLWIDEAGRISAAQPLPNGRPSLGTTIRWIGDPLTWKGFSHRAPKLRASARRTLDSARILLSTSSTNRTLGTPTGYLLRTPSDRTVPLYAGVHPVTGDQLLTTDPGEITRLGYRKGIVLGHLIASAPVTGTLGPLRPAAPWAARFGDVPVARRSVTDASS